MVIKSISSGVRLTRFPTLTASFPSSVTVGNCYMLLSMEYLRSTDNAFCLAMGLSQGNTSSLNLSFHV